MSTAVPPPPALRPSYVSWRAKERQLFNSIEESIAQIRTALSAESTLSATLKSASAEPIVLLNKIEGPPVGLAGIHNALRQSYRRIILLFFEIQFLLSQRYMLRVIGAGTDFGELQKELDKYQSGVRVSTMTPSVHLSSADVCNSGNDDLLLLIDQIGLRLECNTDSSITFNLLLVYDVLADGTGINLTPSRNISYCPNDPIDPTLWDSVAPVLRDQQGKSRRIDLPFSLDMIPGTPVLLHGENVDSCLSLFGDSSSGRHPLMTPLSSVRGDYDVSVGIFPVVLRTLLTQQLATITDQYSAPFNTYTFAISRGPVFVPSEAAIDFRVSLDVHVQGTIDLKIGHIDWGVSIHGDMPVRCLPSMDQDSAVLHLTCRQNGKIDLDNPHYDPEIANAVAGVADALTGAYTDIKNRVNQIDLGVIVQQDIAIQGASRGICLVDADRVVLSLDLL